MNERDPGRRSGSARHPRRQIGIAATYLAAPPAHPGDLPVEENDDELPRPRWDPLLFAVSPL